jgi:hypothetical protein
MATRRSRTAKKPAAKKSASRETMAEPAASKLVFFKRPRPAHPARPAVDKARLKALVEDAIVDAYTEDEQRVGFLTMIQDHLAVPFDTEVLGVPVQVTGIDFNDADEIVALCKRGPHAQRIPVLDLPLPAPPPLGFEWIEAYRYYRHSVD